MTEINYPFISVKKNVKAFLDDVSKELNRIGYKYHFYIVEDKTTCQLEVQFLKHGSILDKDAPKRFIPIDQTSLGGRVLINGKYQECDVKETHAAWQAFWQKHGLKRFLGVPLRIEEVVYGILVVARTKNESFSRTAIETVQRLAAQLAFALHNLEIINSILFMIDRDQELMLGRTHEESLLYDICIKCKELSQSDKAYIFLIDQETGLDSSDDLTVKTAIQHFSDAIMYRPTLCFKEIYSDVFSLVELANLIQPNITTIAIKKIVEIIRLIYISKQSQVKDFYELKVIDVIEDIVTLETIFNISIKDQQSAQIRQLNISSFLLSDFSLLSLKGCSFGRVEGSVAVKNDENPTLMFPYLICLSNKITPTEMIFGEGLTAYAARSRKEVIEENKSINNHYSTSHKNSNSMPNSEPCRSIIAYPLLNDNKIIGVLKVDNRSFFCPTEGQMDSYLFNEQHKEAIRMMAGITNTMVINYQIKIDHNYRLQGDIESLVNELSGMAEDTLYSSIVDRISKISGFPMCTMYLIDKGPKDGFDKVAILDVNTFKKAFCCDNSDIDTAYELFKSNYENNMERFSNRMYLLKMVACVGYDQSQFPRAYIVDSDDKKINIVGEGIAAYIARRRSPVIIRNRASLMRHPSWSGHLGSDSLGKYERMDYKQSTSISVCNTSIGVPLKAGREILGVLKIESSEEKKPTDQDMLKLEILSNAIVIALRSVKTRGRSYEVLFGLDIFKSLIALKDIIHNTNEDELSNLNRAIFDSLISFYHKIEGSSPVIFGEKDIEQGILTVIQELCAVLGFNDKVWQISRDFKTQEGVLYSTEFYRDHYFHQFHTFLIGYVVLNHFGLEDINTHYLDKCATSRAESNNILRAWFISAILHDMAYPIEKIDKWINRFLGTMFSPSSDKSTNDKNNFMCYIDLTQGLDNIHHYILSTLEAMLLKRLKICDNDQINAIGAFRNAFHTQKEHALFGAVMLLSLSQDDLHKPLFWEAALAIALHHSFRGVKGNLSSPLEFIEFPLPFLLAYCDLVQEWGRLPEIGSNNYIAEMRSRRLRSIDRNGNIIISSLVYNLDYYFQAVSSRPNYRDILNEFKIDIASYDDLPAEEKKRTIALKLMKGFHSKHVREFSKKWYSSEKHFHLNYYYRDSDKDSPEPYDNLDTCFIGNEICNRK